LPHSEIDGSKPVCGSPSLIAAYHVLHRLLAPRHPPCALSSLTIRTLNLTQSAFGLQPSAFRTRPEDLRTDDRRPSASVQVNTHCECVVGKLPLQNIQLSKNPPSPASASFGCFGAASARQARNVATTPSSCAPAQSFESRQKSIRPFACIAPRSRAPWRYPATFRSPAAERASARPANTVENTGLEPVTSWLQTRRSPS
jgi:hypothetical protein